MSFESEMAKARTRVAEMDEVDGSKDRKTLTIMLALEAGLKNPESGAQYDALVMLNDLCGRR